MTRRIHAALSVSKGRILLILIAGKLFAEPIGWGDPSLVDRRADEFGVCCHEGEARLYAVTTSMKGAFSKEAPTTLELALLYTEGGKFERRVLTEVTLAPTDQPFPLHPSVSALGDEILVAWQETQPSGNASGIYYMYSATGPAGFTTKQVLPSSAGKLNAILPKAKITAPGQHIILYQEPAAANRFRLVAAHGGRGVFSVLSPVAEISGGTRGALFPATIRRGKRIDILYQNRAEATLIDDIFRAFSQDGGLSWGGNVRVTNNGFQNFSAQVTDAKDKLVFIWQSNPNRVWSIFAAPEGSEPIAVNDNASPSYLPAIVAGAETAPGGSTAIVAAWQDTRNGAPQIYAKFLDRPENNFVGVDHRVTKEGIASKPMEFARLGNRPFLFYGCGPGLCVREADTTAEPVRIFSRTHTIGQVSKSSDAVFNWPKLNDISGVESYAWVIDDAKDTNPDFYNLNARATQITVPGLNGGAYYLHIKYRDKAGNVSPVTHYPFVVDSVPPSRPIITSPTHDNGIPDSRQEVVLRFNSADDSGIATYRYAFAEKLPRVFADTTSSTELTFNDVPPGKYVFAVEAVDLGGNVSERAFYRIEIGVNERNDLTIRHNAEADVITRPDIAFTIEDKSGRGIREVYYLAGFDIRDPFTGKKANLEAEENIYTARIRGLEAGTAVISLGIVYADGTRAAPRHFYFDSNDPRARKAFQFTDIEYEKVIPVPERSPYKVGGRAELISSRFDRGILEIRLNYDTADACRNAAVRGCKPKQIKVKGFVWEIASVERIPQGEINFSGPVEFIYLQKPGRYFVNAKTLFKGPEREQFAYDSRSVDVPDVRKEFRKQLYTTLAVMLAILLLIALWQRRRIAFYAGAWG
jgi:hypothetical protein